MKKIAYDGIIKNTDRAVGNKLDQFFFDKFKSVLIID